MLMRCFLPAFVLLFFAIPGWSQMYKISGTVTNNKLEPLAFVNIQVKELQWGVMTRENGRYEIKLEKGKYDLVITMIGFRSQTITLVLDRDYEQNIILEYEADKRLGEVVIKGKSKDYAEEIVRQVIKRKDSILEAPGPYSCKLYIKAVQQDSSNRNKKEGRIPDSVRIKNPYLDLAGMNMTEISIKLDYESEQKIKEERIGIKKNGNSTGLFFLSATEGNFNFYNNLLRIPGLSPTPFLSPVSYSGLVAYKFKTVKVEQKGRYRHYTISVRPKKVSNATVEGEMMISDSAWCLLHTKFRFPKYHMPEYDFFQVEQAYDAVYGKAIMLTRQEFLYETRGNKRKSSGKTTVTYHDYELQKQFPRKHFGEEVSATSKEAYEKDSLFWKTTRSEPLSEKEIRFIRYRDSLHRVVTSERYLDSMEKVINRFTWKRASFNGHTIYNRSRERTWHLPAFLSLYQPLAFGGARINPSFSYFKTYPNRKNLSIWTNLSYGFRNRDINGSISLSRLYNPFNRGFFRISAQRDFDFIFQGDAWINMLKRSNYFLNHSFGASHHLELLNGLFFYSDVDIALRRSVSNYRVNNNVDSVIGNLLTNNQAVAFDSYNALYGKVRLQYTPKQRYIREPREKVILGSAWPTFYTTWRKGIPGPLNSKVNFDYLEFGIEQQIELGLIGISRYNIKTGHFPNRKDLRLIDYQFQRRGDPLLFLNPDHAFQALDSSFPVFKRFYQGHYVHEFNGAILNKIPLFKKLQLREMGGAGFLIAPERDLRYAELFIGVERTLKSPFDPLSRFKLGIYVVTSVANKFHNPVQFKLGITAWDKRRNRWY